MTAPLLLRCPECQHETSSTRRGPHAPCIICALAGRVVKMLPVNPTQHYYDAKQEELPAVAPQRRMLGADTLAPVEPKNCLDTGRHSISGGVCVDCGTREPADVCSGPAWRAAEAERRAQLAAGGAP